jgi:hypothetical protein
VVDSALAVQHTVDVQLRVTNDLLDLAVLLEVLERFPCKRTVNLQAIDEGGDCDEAVGLNILLELVVGLLVEDDGVLGLVLDCASVSGGFWITKLERHAVCRNERRRCERMPAKPSRLGEVLIVCVVVSRTLALRPLLLLLLASGCYWCLYVRQRSVLLIAVCVLFAATYHFVGCVVVLRGGPVAEVVISQVCGAVCPLTDSVSELERSDPST